MNIWYLKVYVLEEEDQSLKLALGQPWV